MQVPTEKSRVVRFGVFEVDLQEAELRKSGIRIKLQDQPFQVLTMLLERPGETVTREELRNKLWPADTFVDFDHSLNSSIKKVREALGDDSDNPRFIETLHRRGYRFIAPVEAASNHDLPATENVKGEIDRAATGLRPGLKRFWSWRKWSVVALVFGAALLAFWLRSPLPPPRILAARQITNDGLLKGSFVTDGIRIYFLENFNTAPKIVQVSATGGETAPLDSQILYPAVLDISHDRSELLVHGKDESYWILPQPSGAPRRIGDASGGVAAWAPNGKLVFAKGNDFYIAEHDGSNPRKFATAPDWPCAIDFSPDGTRFRFTVWNATYWTLTIWEARADGSDMHPVFPGWTKSANECCGHWTPDGKYYVFEGKRDGKINTWIVREHSSWWRRTSLEPVELAAGPLELASPFPSPDGKKLFAVGRHQRGELVRYDARSGDFVPYLGGISAGELDFSRDGQWITYVSYPDGALWRSRLDGSDRLQLTYSPMQAVTPHWSTDGQQIAFSGHTPGRPWKLFLISKDGGSPQAVTTEEAAERDPSWSPDGRTLAFGHLDQIHDDQTCIKVLDLKTHQVSEMPGTRQMFAPRWSPDGRYMLAETYPADKLMLYDVEKRAWQAVGGLQSIDAFAYLAWSRDSAYVYFDGVVNDESKYLRLRMKDSKLEQLIDVKKKLTRRFPFEFGASWTGLGPGDTPLFVRDISTQEIYALDLELP